MVNKMVMISKVNLICMNCGFELRQVATFWLKQNPNFKCPACSGTDHWRKIPHVSSDKSIERVRQAELWKKLLITQNKSKFVKGNWKLTKHWKKYNDWIQDMEEEHKHNKAKMRALKMLQSVVDEDGKQELIRRSIENE